MGTDNLPKKRGGQKGNAGGGRKPEAFKKSALFLLAKYGLLERLAKIGAGENVDVTHTIDGRAIPCPAPMAAQVNAIKELADRGLGKSVQTVDIPQMGKFVIVRAKENP